MTKTYDQLAEEPQTQINRNRLNLEERQELRQISVGRTSDVTNLGGTGNFETIYYLEGDERRAAEAFVDENRDALKGIDFSKKNILQTSVPRVVHDWVLHFLGKREIRKYETVVLEIRDDGPQWVIDRQQYDEYPNRRYTTSENRSARVDDLSLTDLYDEFRETILESDLRDHEAVSGNVRYILDYYRVAGEFDCDPVSLNGEMAVRKCDE